MSLIRQKPSCQICGHPRSKKSYNCYVCNPCRVFFKRNCLKSFVIRCDGTANCEISYRKPRFNCSACRLKKCLEAKMSRSDENGNIVEPLHQIRNSYVPMNKMLEMYDEMINTGFKIAGNLRNFQNISEWIDCLAYYDQQILNPGGSSPSSVVANASMSLTNLLMYPGSCIDRSTAAMDTLTDVDLSLPYKLKETLCRHFVAAAESMACLEEFHLLPLDDKLQLLQQNAMMWCCYVAMHRAKVVKKWDRSTSVRYFSRFKNADGVASLWHKTLAMFSSPNYFTAVQLFMETRPTEKECLIMRLRSLFCPTSNLSPDGHMIAIKVRVKLAYNLGQYIRELNPFLSNEDVHKRLCQLLELEHYMKEFADCSQNVYQSIVLQNSAEWSTQLLHDIFIRKF